MTDCEDLKPQMMSYLDGELSDEERRRFESHLSTCARCAEELAGFREMKERLAMLKFREPTDVELEQYWRRVYNRMERGIGWILFSLGTVLVLSYAALMLVKEFISDSQAPLIVRIGVVGLVVGGVALFVSVLRERLTVRKADRYSREVER